jgi:hypothetical protein
MILLKWSPRAKYKRREFKDYLEHKSHIITNNESDFTCQLKSKYFFLYNSKLNFEQLDILIEELTKNQPKLVSVK